MADKGGIQLLPETRKKIEVKIPGENKMLYIGAGFLIAVLVLFGVAKAMTSKLEAQITEQNVSLRNFENNRDKEAEKKLLALSKQSASISSFLTNHIFWTIALGKIERALQQQVKVVSMNATVSTHTVTLNAVAPSYTVIARQMASLVADDGVTNVDISGAKSTNAGSYEFNITLQFDESKFLRNSNGQ
ncbi:MAG: hypothetical protein AAB452_00105 [Patescibacteria group bacterium]